MQIFYDLIFHYEHLKGITDMESFDYYFYEFQKIERECLRFLKHMHHINNLKKILDDSEIKSLREINSIKDFF